MECNCCGACCTEISISSFIPGHPDGKPAGVRCKHLSDINLCKLFADPSRPAICNSFKAAKWICGSNRDEAVILIRQIEMQTGVSK